MNQLMSRRHFLKAAGVAGLAASASSFTLGQGSTPEVTSGNGRGFYRFRMGDLTIVVVSDGQSVGGSAFPNWGANPDRQEDYAGVLRQNGAPIEPFVNNFNLMLVDSGNSRTLVDTGFGTAGAATVGKALEHLGYAGYAAEDISTVFITHGHPDHIQGLTTGGALNFPNADLVIGDAEYALWAGQNDPSTAVQANLLALEDRFTRVNDGDEIAPGITAVATPGHTAGHMAVLVSSGNEQLMHLGDAGGHYLLSPMFPEHYLGFDADREQVVATRAAIFDRAASEEMLVVGYHYNWPGVGRILRTADAYQFAPAFWRWE